MEGRLLVEDARGDAVPEEICNSEAKACKHIQYIRLADEHKKSE